ncbi:hypothetical protein ACSQ67_018739 [Phaseolus vulgaris]
MDTLIASHKKRFACVTQQSRGCLGCFPNPPIIKGQAMNKDISEDFWSSSALEIDQWAFQSQKSISSIVMPSDPQSSSGIQIDSPEFVNDGKQVGHTDTDCLLLYFCTFSCLLIFNQVRRHWVGKRKPRNKKEVGEHIVSWNASYESLMGTDKPFPRPIPLGEMVDFLVDIWELEGLYD